MATKQGPEKTEFVKEEDEKHGQYIFQKNTKTKTAVWIIAAFLIIIIIGIVVSALFFGNPST